ncbi:MAG TPA: hypothetical protein DD417_05970 [Elusimicrobia bacterium]|nr:hypothetical protein [Elusimicrobiota bacterium]
MASPEALNRLVSALFLLSGATGLLYEVLWTKQLTLSLGSTALAQTFVLASFLGGLALGYAWFGAKADRSPSPLRLYGKLELGIAALAAASPFVFRWIELLPSGIRPALAAAYVLAPAALMGGTLPALCRWTVPLGPASRAASSDTLRQNLAWLYFLNNAGAVLGTVAAGFLLIPALGLDVPIWLAAALNLAIGTAVLALSERGQPKPLDPAPDLPSVEAAGWGPWAWTAAAFLCGFVSLCYEIGWIRLAGLSLGSSTYSFALMLAAFIAGLAVGTLVLARGAFADEDSGVLFAWTQFGVAASILLSWPFYERLPFISLILNHWLPRSLPAFYGTSALLFAACWLLMLAPAAFLGAALPLAARAAFRGGAEVGSGVGRIFAGNTAGNVAGAFAAGLWLLPNLGLERLFQLGMAVNIAVGLAALIACRRSLKDPRRTLLAAGAAALMGMGLVAGMRLDRAVLTSGTFRMDAPGRLSFRDFKGLMHQGRLLFDRDDPEFTVTVLETPDGVRYLKSNGKAEASTGSDMATQALLAHLPLTLHPGAQEALLIGLGSGITAGSALRHPLTRLDVVEIARGVADAEPFFRPVNGAPLADPRAALHIADAKTFLRESRRSYDVIISEPSNPWVSGVGGLFSAGFYHEARSRLRPGGVMVQWFHLYEMSDEILSLVLRTFCAEFPHATLWDIGSNDILLVGSSAPLEYPFPLMEAAVARPPVQEELRRLGLGRLSTLLSLQAGSDAAVRRAAGTGPLNRDRAPLLEYRAPLALYLNGVSGLVGALDERRPPANGRGLAMAEYLPRRGRPFDRAELRELVWYHGRYGGPVFAALRADWNRRFPDAAIRSERDIMDLQHGG